MLTRAVFVLLGLVLSDTRLLRMLRRETEIMLDTARKLDGQALRRRVSVGPMPGLGPEMLDWSAAMTLAHTAQALNALARTLPVLHARRPVPAPDYENDFTPSPQCGPEQVEALRDALAEYEAAVEPLIQQGRLRRGGPTLRHPVFQRLDAHQCHLLAWVHGWVHLRQLQAIAKRLD